MAPTTPLQGSKGSGNGHRVRGVRDAQDIIDAALAQGWTFDRSSNHYRLLPPGELGKGGRGVGISGTPSDINYRQQIVRCLRRTGQFQWPWPPRTITNQMPDLDPIALDWRPVPHCSAYEFCQAGVVRNKLTLQIITPAENGNFPLTDDRGKLRHFSARALCRAAFNHGPIEKLVDKAKEETAVTAAAVEIDEELDSGQQDAAQRAVEATTPVSPEEHWEIVLIEGIEEGYEVNEMGDVLGPPRGKEGQRKKLVPQLWPSGTRITLRLLNKGPQQKFMLNEIVLEAFEARPAPHWVPEHIDGNPHNCARSNLRWVEGKKLELTKIPEETPVTTSASTPAVNPSVESIADTIQESARLTIEQEEAATINAVNKLAEGSWPLPAEAYHLDYPYGSNREGRPYSGDPELEKALEGVVHPTSFVRLDSPGYPNDHMAQDEELIAEWNAAETDITSYHVHKHVPSGLILKVHGDGRVEQPVIKAHQMSILTQLLAAAAAD